MVSLFFNLFIISWTWLTIRLRTKKHNVIRICVSLFFIIFNLIAIIVWSTETYIKENDYSAYLVMLIFYITLLVLWVIRLCFDILFISKKNFEKKEEKLGNIIKKRLHIGNKQGINVEHLLSRK